MSCVFVTIFLFLFLLQFDLQTSSEARLTPRVEYKQMIMCVNACQFSQIGEVGACANNFGFQNNLYLWSAQLSYKTLLASFRWFE